jgi:cell volume regulation protein A
VALDPSIALLVAGFLVLTSVLASLLSDRIGVPALLIFLSVGMLAGSDGPGGINFDDPGLASFIGTIALAFILFSGGLDTNWRLIRPVFGRGLTLSTLGVILTAGLVGLFAWGALGFSLPAGLLLGAIVSSTDAAAVFSVLRGRGVGLKGNLKPLLEFESGSNDPMAIFLTLGLTQLVTVPDFAWPWLVPGLFLNMAGGAVAGALAGKGMAYLLNRIKLDYEGLYPVLTLSTVLFTFGFAELIEGNGFLAVYICGILLNGSDFAYKRYVIRFHDGLAWLMQIGMFLVLGLLVFPTHLPAIALSALAVAVFLILVARPLAVAISMVGSEFNWRERSLVAWTGLRGAVPIVLATFPLMAGYEASDLIFNIVFFTVLTSVVVQGTLLMPMARWLKVDEPMASRPSFSLEIERKGQAQGETREFEILPNMAAVGCKVMDLGVPPDVLILLIGRGDGFVVPRGQTQIEPYDTLLMLGDPDSLKAAHHAILSPPKRVPKAKGPLDPLAALPYTTDERFLSKQVVVVGYGRVGKHICKSLKRAGLPYIIVDERRDLVDRLRKSGEAAVFGDASQDIVLVQAHIMKAAMLVIATPDTMKVRKMVDAARSLNPGIRIAIRSHSEVDALLLEKELAGRVFIAEHELGDNMVRHILEEVSQD